MRFLSIFAALFLTLPVVLSAQVGGRTGYDFLRFSPSARITGAGGRIVSLLDGDPQYAWQNPAANSDSTDSRVSMAYGSLFGDVGLVSAAYSRKWAPLGNFWGGIRHFTYGAFQEFSENGVETGTFGVNGTDLTVGASRSYGKFRYGANFRLLQHTVYRSTSTAFAFDFGGTYYNPGSQTGVGAAVTNIGYNISKYDASAGAHELPFDITVGISQKLANAPFRLTLTLHQLNRLRMVRDDPDAEQEFDLAGNPVEEGSNTTEDIFRHMNLGLEILFSPNFQLRTGYSHQRRQELRAPESGFTLDGFSLGASIRISKLYLDYSYAGFHAVGGMHHVQASVFLNQFGKSRSKPAASPVEKETPTPEE